MFRTEKAFCGVFFIVTLAAWVLLSLASLLAEAFFGVNDGVIGGLEARKSSSEGARACGRCGRSEGNLMSDAKKDIKEKKLSYC